MPSNLAGHCYPFELAGFVNFPRQTKPSKHGGICMRKLRFSIYRCVLDALSITSVVWVRACQPEPLTTYL